MAVAKDRAAPFSRKHRRYWIPVLGMMLLIGAINLGLGFCSYEPPPPPPEKYELHLPTRDAGLADAPPAPATPR